MTSVTHWKSGIAAGWSGPATGGTVGTAGTLVVHGLRTLSGGTINHTLYAATASFGTVTSLGTVSGGTFNAFFAATAGFGTITGSGGTATVFNTVPVLIQSAGSVSGSVLQSSAPFNLAAAGTISGGSVLTVNQPLQLTSSGTITSGSAFVISIPTSIGAAGTAAGTIFTITGALNTGANVKGTISGDVQVAYLSNTGGTAHAVTTGLGTVYKVTGGTGYLTAGSLAITPALSNIMSIQASFIGGGTGIAVGTTLGSIAPLQAIWDFASGAGGTAAIVSHAGTIEGAVSGTLPVSWLAFGF